MSDKLRRIHCFVDIKINGNSAGRIVLELFSDVCPKTCSNFISLCNGETVNNEVVGFKGSAFTALTNAVRVNCSCSSYSTAEMLKERIYPDEVSVLKHFKELLLSTATRGGEATGLHWLITTACAPELDSTHLVFGRVVSGQGVVVQIHSAMLKSGHTAKVNNCGELKTRALDQRKPPTLYNRSRAVKYNSSEMSDSSNYSNERTSTETQEKDFTLASLLKKNNKLSRGATASLMSSAERNVKGRGTVRYRGSSSGSRSESDTPPHWRTELNKTKSYKRNSEDESRDRWIKGDKLKYYDSYDSRSERKGKSGSDDYDDDDYYQRRSQSIRRHKKRSRSRCHEGRRGGRSRERSRERSFSRSRRHSDRRSRNISESSRATEESLCYDTRRGRRRRSKEDLSNCSQTLQTCFSESEFESYEEGLKKSSRPLPTADGDKSRKSGKKEKSSGKQEKHSRENWPKSKRSKDRGSDGIACDVRTPDEQDLVESERSGRHGRRSSPVNLASVASSSAVDRSGRLGKSDVKINLSRARHSSPVENQTDGTQTVSSESERSKQNSSELLQSSNKFQCFGGTEAQKSRAAHDEGSLVYKSTGSTKEGHRKSRDVNEVKYSDYLENLNSSGSRKYQGLTLNTSDKAIMIKKASKERHRNRQIGLGLLKSDSRIKYPDENDPVYCVDSDASGRADGKTVQSSDRHVVEIPSSNDDDGDEAKYELPAKRTKYASDDVDDATSDSEKKFYSGKTSKADRYYREIGFTEQEKIVAYANISERSRSSSDNSKSRSQLGEEEKHRLGRRIGRSEGNARCTSITQKYSGERKAGKQSAALKSTSKENSKDASQQKHRAQQPLSSSKRKYGRSETRSTTGSLASVHSRLSYFKGNRSPSASPSSSGRRSVSSRRKRHRRASGRGRSSSSSRSPEISKRPSRCRSSRSISRIRSSSSSSSSRSRSWKSSRSGESSFTSETFSSRSLRSDSKSKRKTGDRSKAQKRRPHNFCDSSSVNVARMATAISVPSFVASSAVQSLSDSPPPSRWKPGQKPWQPKKVFQVSSSVQPVLAAEPRADGAESFACSSPSVPLARTKRRRKDEKISEEHLEEFHCSRREGFRRVSKPPYGKSSSSSSVERELPLSRRRRRGDRQTDDTPDDSHSDAGIQSSRSGSLSDDRSAGGSGKTQTSNNEMRKVRCKEWSSSDESEGIRSTDRTSKQRSSLGCSSRKASRLGNTKEEISREERTTTNFQKSETSKKRKSQVHQTFQWQPPVEPEDESDAEEDEGERTKDFSQLSICRRRRRRVRAVEDVYNSEAQKSQAAQSVGVQRSTAEAKDEAEATERRSEPENLATDRTAKDGDEIDGCPTVASDATAAVTEDDNDDRSFLSVTDEEEERDQKQSFNIAAELNVDAAVDLSTMRYGAETHKDSLPIQSNSEVALETENMKFKVEHKVEAAEEKSDVGGLQSSDLVTDFDASSIKPESKNSSAGKTQIMVFYPKTKILKDCSEASNNVSLFEMESNKRHGAVSPTAYVNTESLTDAAEVKSHLLRHQMLHASCSGPSRPVKQSLNENRVLTKQLNFMWKSRSRLSASRPTGPVRLDSPASPDVSARVLSPGECRDAEEALVPSSSVKSPAVHTEQSARLNSEQDLEPTRARSAARDSPEEYKKTDSVDRLHGNSQSSRDSQSSRSSSRCSKIYISSGSEDESKKLRRRAIASRSPSVLLRSSRSPTVSRDRSYDRWQSRSSSRSSSSDGATGRHSSDSTTSGGTECSSSSRRPGNRNASTRSDSSGSLHRRSRSGNGTSRSRSRSGRTRRYAERSRTRSRHRYSSQDYYSSSEGGSWSRSSRSRSSRSRCRSKRKSSQSHSSASYRRRRRRGSSRRSYRQSSSSN